MLKKSAIYVAGHRGLAGSAIVRKLRAEGYRNLITRTHQELDLANQEAVRSFFELTRPEYVYLAAARVGGILANDTYPADFIRDNLLVQINVIESAFRYGARKLIFLGSSCIYPKFAPQPMTEDCLLSGPLEPTNDAYAIAKIAGIKMCQSFRKQHGFDAISLMPTNLYGPGDNFDLQNAHVLPAMMRRFHEAKLNNASDVTIWGTGTPRREFLHVDDLASAALFLTHNYSSPEIVNVGTGRDVAISELASQIRNVVGYEGYIQYDASKPDGTPRKLLDVSKLSALGWTAQTSLSDGLQQTYNWFIENQTNLRGGEKHQPLGRPSLPAVPFQVNRAQAS